jgi:predicted transcriptional regulator
MKIHRVIEVLDATVLCGSELLDREIQSAGAADLMSDVLAYIRTESLLLTGLTNTQVIRTADMMDIVCIVFVRGKKPTAEVVEYGRAHDMVLLSTPYKMYYASGLLFQAGLGACE